VYVVLHVYRSGCTLQEGLGDIEHMSCVVDISVSIQTHTFVVMQNSNMCAAVLCPSVRWRADELLDKHQQAVNQVRSKG
jgi:hypothetical protein